MAQSNPYVQNKARFEATEDRNVFVIMRYAPGAPFDEIESAIKDTLADYHFIPVLARDLALDPELWHNVRFCMDHCRYAIALFERIQQPDYNPNVTLELGYMLALGRPCLILKDTSLPTLHTDIIGRLYLPFDTYKASQTIRHAIETWLKQLGHSRIPSAQTITAPSHMEANKLRTRHINKALLRMHSQIDQAGCGKILRQAASLSSLAISDTEFQRDHDFHSLIIQEREAVLSLLSAGWTVRLIICPESQIEWAELNLVDHDEVTKTIFFRYDQLIKVLQSNLDNPRLQISYTLRLPHDNLLIIDEGTVFIARRRHRDAGFPYTTMIFDPAVIRDESCEFDAAFADNAGAILGKDPPDESDFGSRLLKEQVIAKLRSSKRRLRRITHDNKNRTNACTLSLPGGGPC